MTLSADMASLRAFDVDAERGARECPEEPHPDRAADASHHLPHARLRSERPTNVKRFVSQSTSREPSVQERVTPHPHIP